MRTLKVTPKPEQVFRRIGDLSKLACRLFVAGALSGWDSRAIENATSECLLQSFKQVIGGIGDLSELTGCLFVAGVFVPTPQPSHRRCEI